MSREWIAFLIGLAVIAAAVPFALMPIRNVKRKKGTAQLVLALFFGFAFLNNRDLMRIEDTRDEHKRKPPDPGGDRPTPVDLNDITRIE